MEPIESSGEPHNSMNSKRRSSSRFIKRRKFDDELVESSLHATVSTVPARPGRVRTHSATNPATDVGSLSSTDPTLPETFIQVEPSPNPPRNRRLSGKSTAVGSSAAGSSGNRKRKLTKHNLSSCYKDLGRWKPIDDLLLIQGVLQTSDLRAVYQGVKFSCKFTFNEIAQRWYALVYDRNISRLALSAIRNLQAETIAQVEANCLYAENEEEVLATLKSTIDPKLSVFEELLARNRHIFHRGRTPKSLYVHWCMMKQHNLLSDQLGTEKPISIPTMVTTEERNNALLNSFGNVTDTPLQRSENIPSFAECEEFLNDSELLNEVKDSALDKQLSLMDRISKKDIRMLEDELSQIQLASAALPGANSFEFDNGTLAVLRGKCVRYLMRSKEITLGRKTQDNEVDVDLSLEGPAWKISRRQATIRVKNNGEFLIASEGKRPIYVDGTPISTGNKRVLNNNSVLEIAGLRFIFLINYEFLNIVIRHDTTKTNLKS